MISLLALAAPLYSTAAHAGDFMDVWVTSAFEDTNVAAGPTNDDEAPNFVLRGNSTFFENYESKYTNDISQSHLVLYRKDQGFNPHIFTEAAMVLRFAPYIDGDSSKPGVNIADDGSYVRVGYKFGGKEDHNLSLTGYAVDADRFRLGYSYDLTWGGRDTFVFDPLAAPGARLQYQNGSFYLFGGVKTAIGQFQTADSQYTPSQAYYGQLYGIGGEIGSHLRLEGGVGSIQQGQLDSVTDASSPLYHTMITAAGACAQISVRTTDKIDYVVSNELKLYRNSPDFVKDSYISHRHLDGTGLLVQAEANALEHNLLDPANTGNTLVEKAFAGDMQALVVHGDTELGVDLVYKDLAFIVFDVPGITSQVGIPTTMQTSPQMYARGQVTHYFEKAHLTPSLGVGYMKPASYNTGSAWYVQYDASTVRHVPDGHTPADIMSGVAGIQWDISKSVVGVGQLLYTLDNNESVAVTGTDGSNTYASADALVRNRLGFNLMLRARF